MMTMLVVAIILVFSQAGTVKPVCPDGEYDHYGVCYKCSWNTCSKCDDRYSCSECKPYKYGNVCQNDCGGCKSGACDKVNGDCTNGCDNGYYMSNNVCNPCRQQCSLCNSQSCSECEPGYYGQNCQYACSKCKDGACNKSNGKCTTGCKDTFYLYNGYCRQCEANCKTCSNSIICSACNTGYFVNKQSCSKCPTWCRSCIGWDSCIECKEDLHRWGSSCQYTCTGCINNCNKNNGCSACEGKYFRRWDNTQVGYVCEPCLTTCKTCSDTTSCESCEYDYWGGACENSCEGCKSDCFQYLGCYNGCEDGFYRVDVSHRTHCYQCPATCKTCDSNTTCTSCNPGYNGITCQYDCSSCNGNLCNWNDGICTHICSDNQYFDSLLAICQNCPEGCTRCSMSSLCDDCRARKWGKICQNDCSRNCQQDTCDKNNGYCYPCTIGHWGNKCIDNCMPGCYQCSSGTSCQTCKSGFFSLDNNKKCECSEDQCLLLYEGTCKSCHNMWYPFGQGCCPCSDTCKDNACYANRTCVECKDLTKYGDNCDKACNWNCKDLKCSRDGSCHSCRHAYRYGSKCDKSCSSAISQCASCHGHEEQSLPTCTKCNSGYYVSDTKCIFCSTKCKHGRYYCNTTNGYCKYGCETSWFNSRCNSQCNVTHCHACPNNFNECVECDDGFYAQSQSSCLPCPANCKVWLHCNKQSGTCNGCIAGYTGESCSESCNPRCKSCSQFNKTYCTICKLGYFGDSCEADCSTGCELIDETHPCGKTNGYCDFGCSKGLWGYTCDLPCGNGCSGDICNITTGECLSQCHDTHFGQMCDDQCSEKCNNAKGRSCNEANGHCLNGCHVGWFRSQCNEECSKNCKENICDRNNGSCISGCTDGYTGPMCMQALLKDDPGSNTAAIGGGAGAGVAILVILVVIVVAIVLRRRKASSKMETRDGGSVAMNDSFKQSEPAGPEYSNINEARIVKESSEVPGVMNLVYANTAVRMSDVSVKDEVINAQTTPARPTSVDYLKEIEDDEDITVDDDEADANVVADDTYYNIGGQRVAVAKLAEYIKNKSLEDLLKDFEKIPKGLLKSYNEAKKSTNAAKNKYRAIYPYDENRVILQDGGSDYMNASYIDGYNRQKEYIASSGPFKRIYDTTSDFWRMIFQERCETLVMLTQPMEDGKTKCTKYWPDADESCQYGEIQITCLTDDVYADFTIRILAVTKDKVTMNIRHVHFTAWPDKGIPHDVTSMIELRQRVRSLHKDKESPIIVHCSAGIGRTGTFIVLDMLTFEGEDRGSVDIFGSLVSLRNQRCNMVQTPEQYVYLHHAVLHSLTFDCRSIPGDMFLQNYNKMIERNGGGRIIDKHFKQLQSISEEVTDEDRAQIQKNKALSNKNRKDADVPADEGRVKLHDNRKPGASDYINAVYVNSFRRKRKFICAQTPLPSTVVDFLSLIQQERCTCIVSMEEPDINDKTVKVYWPADNQVVKHGVFKVRCNDSQTTAHYVSKKLSITYHGPNGEESQDVNLFIFTNWPKDSLVPKTSDSLLELVKTVDAMNRTPEYEAPILIHCRTGAERSCLYCVVSVLIEKMEIEHEVSVVNTLRQIKARRLSATSSVEQYKFCHQAVISYLQSFDIYSNFGLKEADA